MHPVRIGTCGWSYKEWSGVFYPEDLAAGDWLPYLAERYPVVEVDSTFYRSPTRKAVEGWRDRTPPGFGFSLKVPQTITHENVLLDCHNEVSAFLGAARVLGEKLLCCLPQFGYFGRGKFATLGAFLFKRLRGQDFGKGYTALAPPRARLQSLLPGRAGFPAARSGPATGEGARIPDEIGLPKVARIT